MIESRDWSLLSPKTYKRKATVQVLFIQRIKVFTYCLSLQIEFHIFPRVFVLFRLQILTSAASTLATLVHAPLLMTATCARAWKVTWELSVTSKVTYMLPSH